MSAWEVMLYMGSLAILLGGLTGGSFVAMKHFADWALGRSDGDLMSDIVEKAEIIVKKATTMMTTMRKYAEEKRRFYLSGPLPIPDFELGYVTAMDELLDQIRDATPDFQPKDTPNPDPPVRFA